MTINESTGEVLASKIDFKLFARDAAEFATEKLGYKISASGFRQLVIAGVAPAPVNGSDTNALWSQVELSEWINELQEEESSEDKSEDSKEESKAVHTDVYEFYERTFSVYYELHNSNKSRIEAQEDEQAGGLHWCPQWWEHRSVVGRLTAAWYAWEAAHADGGAAMSSWILEHADRHFDRITSHNGPFHKCWDGHTSTMTVFPTDPIPEDLRDSDLTEGEEE